MVGVKVNARLPILYFGWAVCGVHLRTLKVPKTEKNSHPSGRIIPVGVINTLYNWGPQVLARWPVPKVFRFPPGSRSVEVTHSSRV